MRHIFDLFFSFFGDELMLVMKGELSDYAEHVILLHAPHSKYNVCCDERKKGNKIVFSNDEAAWILWSDNNITYLAESIVYSSHVPRLILFEKLEKKDNGTYEGIVRLMTTKPIWRFSNLFKETKDIYKFISIFSGIVSREADTYFAYIINTQKRVKFFSRAHYGYIYQDRRWLVLGTLFNIGKKALPRLSPIRISHAGKIYDVILKPDKTRNIFIGGDQTNSVLFSPEDLPKIIQLAKEVSYIDNMESWEDIIVEKIKKYFPEYFF